MSGDEFRAAVVKSDSGYGDRECTVWLLVMGGNKMIFANDLGFEVVALCLDESCPGFVE